eukprot:scaffold126678_cov31-Tisochrysis_lutea.AAC.2
METNAGLRIVGAPLGSKMRRDTYAPTPLHTNCEITGSSSSGNRLGLSARLKHQHSSPEKLLFVLPWSPPSMMEWARHKMFWPSSCICMEAATSMRAVSRRAAAA